VSKQEYLIETEEIGSRLDQFLALRSQKARTYIQELIQAGGVSVNDRKITKPSYKLKRSDRVLVDFTEHKSQPDLIPVPGDLSILFEDTFLLVLNKAQGTVVHPASGHFGDTLVHHLLHHLGKGHQSLDESQVRPGIVHRLDKGTSGVLLVAKNREVQEKLSQQFKDRTVEKSYDCIVWGQVTRKGTLNSPIGRDRKHRHKMSSDTTHGRASETSFSPISVFELFSHLKVFPKTGRTHQIRVHLSEWGHPIVSDPVYSRGLTPKRKQSLPTDTLSFLSEVPHPFLHASSLAFTHPISQKRMLFHAPLPSLFQAFLKLLGKTK